MKEYYICSCEYNAVGRYYKLSLSENTPAVSVDFFIKVGEAPMIDLATEILRKDLDKLGDALAEKEHLSLSLAQSRDTLSILTKQNEKLIETLYNLSSIVAKGGKNEQ